MVDLINFPAIAGILVGAYTGGVLMDAVSYMGTRKNHGHFRRKCLIMFFLIVSPMSLIFQSQLTLVF
jgi:hypothetical protein